MTTTATYTLKQPIPVLQVRDVQAAVDFYCTHFGFEQPWVHEGFYGGCQKDGQQVHLMKKEEPAAGMIYNFVDNVDGIYESLKAAGVPMEAEIKDQFYGMRDFTAKDPDGNFIGFAAQIEGK